MTVQDPAKLRRYLLLAIDDGQEAAAATRQIALRNTDPADPNTMTRRWWPSSKTFVVRGPHPRMAQVEGAARLLDEFVDAVAAVNGVITDVDARLPTDLDWSGRLLSTIAAAADVHNEVNHTVATMARYRVNLIMERPLAAGSVDRPGR